MFVVVPFTLYYLKPIQAPPWLTFWYPHKERDQLSQQSVHVPFQTLHVEESQKYTHGKILQHLAKKKEKKPFQVPDQFCTIS